MLDQFNEGKLLTADLATQTTVNLFATIVATLILKYANLLNQESVSLSQLGVIMIVLFSVIMVATSLTRFKKDDLRYLLTMTLIMAGVALTQWTYSFKGIENKPGSVIATQLPVITMIITFGWIVTKWTN